MRIRVELTEPGQETVTRHVKNLGTWSQRMARELRPGTRMTVFKGPGRGTRQYLLRSMTGGPPWLLERETFGEVNSP